MGVNADVRQMNSREYRCYSADVGVIVGANADVDVIVGANFLMLMWVWVPSTHSRHLHSLEIDVDQ